MNYLDLDTLKLQLKETILIAYELMKKLDKIKIKLVSDEKVSKKDLLKIIDGGNNE